MRADAANYGRPQLLRLAISARNVITPELFVNARGAPLTRWGVAYILRRHGQTAKLRCGSFAGKRLSPFHHTFSDIPPR